jgi:hypothetical protein
MKSYLQTVCPPFKKGRGMQLNPRGQVQLLFQVCKPLLAAGKARKALFSQSLPDAVSLLRQGQPVLVQYFLNLIVSQDISYGPVILPGNITAAFKHFGLLAGTQVKPAKEPEKIPPVVCLHAGKP